jgi:hypothetical protein
MPRRNTTQLVVLRLDLRQKVLDNVHLDEGPILTVLI